MIDDVFIIESLSQEGDNENFDKDGENSDNRVRGQKNGLKVRMELDEN